LVKTKIIGAAFNLITDYALEKGIKYDGFSAIFITYFTKLATLAII